MRWLGWLVGTSLALPVGAFFARRRQLQPCANENELDVHAREGVLEESRLGPVLVKAPQMANAEEEVPTRSLARLKAHRCFMEAVDREWQRSARTGRPSSLILMRLEGLEQVIGRKSRWGGDKAQTAVAALIDGGSRPPNIVARYKDDEFAILMPEADAQQAETLATGLRAAAEANHFLRAHSVTARFGIATFPDQGRSLKELLRVADSEMSLANERNQRPPENQLEAASRGTPSSASQKSGDRWSQLEQKKPLLGLGPTFSFTVDADGPFPKGHSQAVSWLSIQIARQMGLSQEEIDEIHLGSLLHDIGKFHLPERVFTKPTQLTPAEYEIMKSHAVRGAKMLEPLELKVIESIVRHHHERHDGTGYPDGLAGDKVPLGARIVAVAECFEDMVSDLGYKKPRTFEDALAELRRCSGTQFDPQVTTAFLEWFRTHGDPREQR